VHGVETERLWAWDFTGFCLLKQHDPSYRLTESAALAGANWIRDQAPWSLGRVLEWLGLELVAVELLPAMQPGVAADADVRAA